MFEEAGIRGRYTMSKCIELRRLLRSSDGRRAFQGSLLDWIKLSSSRIAEESMRCQEIENICFGESSIRGGV